MLVLELHQSLELFSDRLGNQRDYASRQADLQSRLHTFGRAGPPLRRYSRTGATKLTTCCRSFFRYFRRQSI